ncbi:MAG: response regulator [Gemmataceae bacterium]|nr:response regulator [Gemmataceae bacterium]
MVPRTVKLLHIEDDPLQQRLAAHHLADLHEFQFAITCVESEEAAVREFTAGRHEFVLLDYHLAQGNGLSCLRRLRATDPTVPIIAISGAATPEIAAELLRVGADDYMTKQELTSEGLARSVREALARSDAWRRQGLDRGALTTDDAVGKVFRELCQTYVAAIGPDFLAHLDSFEAASRQAGVNATQMQFLFEQVSGELQSTFTGAAARRLLRPLLLEVLLRLFGPEPDEKDPLPS